MLLVLYKNDWSSLGLKYQEDTRVVQLILKTNTSKDDDVAQFIKKYSGPNYFFLPANVVLDEKGKPKNFVLPISEKKINFVIVDQIKDSKKGGYSIVKSFAGLSFVAFLGFICWAYKNNVSSQDMQEAFVALLSKLCNVGK